jgi:hypothetical protein
MNSKAFKLYAIIGKLSLFPGICKGKFIKGLLYGRGALSRSAGFSISQKQEKRL